jgi:hypothetical protein
VDAPLPVSVDEAPLQIGLGLADALTVGYGFTVTATILDVAEQGPFKNTPCTYSVCPGLFATQIYGFDVDKVFHVPPVPSHWYWNWLKVPTVGVAVKVTLAPRHTEAGLAVIVPEGSGKLICVLIFPKLLP